MIEPIRTSRLVLDPIDQATAAAIVTGNLGGLSAGIGWPQDDTISGMRLRSALGGHPACWLIQLHDVVVGELGWKGGPGPDGTAEIGYSLAPSYRGQGIGSEAVDAFTRWALSHGGVRRLVASTDRANIASQRVLEKAGFVVSRTDGEHLYWLRDGSS